MESQVSDRHVQDVGWILLDAEKELQGLREKLRAHLGQNMDASHEIEEVIAKAEKELRQKADLVLTSAMNTKVQRLPLIGDGNYASRDQAGKFIEDDAAAKRAQQKKVGRRGSLGLTSVNNGDQDAIPSTGGDPKTRMLIEQKLKQMMSELETQGRRTHVDGALRSVALRSRTKRNVRSAFAATRRPQTSFDTNNNHGADMTLVAGDRPIITQNRAQIYERPDSSIRPRTSLVTDGQGLASNFRFDIGGDEAEPAGDQPEHQIVLHSEEKEESRALVLMDGPAGKTSPKRRREENLGESVENIRAYEEMLELYGVHMFIIRNGKALTRSNEFVGFKRKHEHIWGAISEIIEKLEHMLDRFSVPIAYVDGQQVAKLAQTELKKLSHDVLLKLVRNYDQVAALVKLPGRQYLKRNAESQALAATKIQAHFRGHAQKQRHKLFLVCSVSARKIQTVFRTFRMKSHFIKRLQEKRANDEATYSAIQRSFFEEWASMKGKSRVIIHVPSLSYSEHLRIPVERFSLLQNLQLSRLCDLKDPSVEIIYIAPFEIPKDVIQYNEKLLTVGGVTNGARRFKVIVPENAHRFPEHFSLATMLLYSPKALKKIKRIVEGRSSYIVPGVVGEEDRLLSIRLNLPVLGPGPDVSALYATKSGAKRIFAAAGVNMPPGAHDLYEAHELITTLAKLVAADLDTQQWLLKIDDEFGGKGHAIVEVSKFKAVQELRVERSRHAGKGPMQKAYWASPEVQERARRILEEAFTSQLGTKIKLVCPEVYPNWERYLKSFVTVGGIIEAIPANIVGRISCNLFVEPDGTVTVLSAHDQLFSKMNPFKAIGTSFPQRTIPHQAMRGAATVIGNTLFQHHVIGYASVDFVSYFDSQNDSLRLCAVDLKQHMTNSAAAFQFFNFLMNGSMHDKSGDYIVHRRFKQEVDDPEDIARDKVVENVDRETRSFISFECMHHPNLSMMRYGEFFNVCRLHGVSFDLKDMSGLAFMLHDSLAGGTIGAMAIATSNANAKLAVHRALNFIHRHAGGYSLRKRAQQPSSIGIPPYDSCATFTDCFNVAKNLLKK